MFAISFDLVVAETELRHPAGTTAAYDEIARTLKRYGFERIQGSVYTTDVEDLANLLQAMNALKALPCFPDCVRDVRAFRVDQWSDFTPFMKSNR